MSEDIVESGGFVRIRCDKDAADALSSLFEERLFRMAGLCRYDSEALSIDCRQAGRGMGNLMARVYGMAIGYLAASEQDADAS